MSTLIPRLVGALALALLATTAGASTAQWRQAVLFEVELGPTDPLVIFGFNPQPEPPPLYLIETELDDARFTKTFRDVPETQGFQYLLGVSMPGETVIVDDPRIVGAFDSHTVLADVGADTLMIRLGFGASNGFLGLDAVAFNPQPEPPAVFGAGFETVGKDFIIGAAPPLWAPVGMDGFDASMTLEIFDGSGRQLQLRQVAVVVPVPAALPVFAATLAGLVLLRRRA